MNEVTDLKVATQDQELVAKFLKETTLFLGPDPEIMRYHNIMPRTRHEGECLDKDGEKAAYWFRKAAEQGLAGSQTTLGMMYQEGNGVKQDMEEAKKWLAMAGFDT